MVLLDTCDILIKATPEEQIIPILWARNWDARRVIVPQVTQLMMLKQDLGLVLQVPDAALLTAPSVC